jgi:hypothetical protein
MKQQNFLFYAVNVKAASWARAYLNDLPLHTQFAPGVDSHSTSINQLLMNGENTLTVDVLAAPEERGEGAVSVHFYTVIDPMTKPMTISTVHRFDFPEVLATGPKPKDRRVPYHHESRFTFDNGGYSPIWASAPPEEEVDCRGTPELRAAVTELYESVERLDIDKFLDLSELRLSEYERAHPGVTIARADTRRDVLREWFSYKPRVPPLDMSAVHFTSRANGRIVHVSREGGGYVLNAPAERDPRRRLKADFLYTRHLGAWRIWG